MKLLFICTHNRCRSILSESITNSIADKKLIAASAGSAPQGDVHPLTIKYLSEKGFNTAGLNSKSWYEFEHYKPDVVLTMCDSAAKETCPVWFSDSLQVNWALEDPSKNSADNTKQKDAFFKTMDIIERRIQAVLDINTSQLSDTELKQAFVDIAARIH